MKMRVAKGKSRMAGKLASTWTTGWAKRESFGLMPIFTPIGHPDECGDRQQHDHAQRRSQTEADSHGNWAKPEMGIEIDHPDHGHPAEPPPRSPPRR